MKKNTSTPIRVCLLLLFVSVLVSCTKDSDLLAEYITEENIEIAEAAQNEQQQDSTNQGGQNPQDPPQDPPEPQDPDPASTDFDMGELKAFPGAEGFGKYATGGRGGIVVEVTNLNDSGSGSLREALKMTVPRTIIFKVGGVIEANSYMEIPSNAGNVTIAGQTAPGKGITIKGAEFRISASNVIVRYLKVRPGDIAKSKNYDGIRVVAWNGSQVENVIIDHCSISWAGDENLNIGASGDNGMVKNVTVQKSIIAENINTGYAVLLWKNAKNISLFRNLLAHNSSRNIRSSTCSSDFEMINNVIYGFKTGTQPTYENKFDIIGNVYKTNPNITPTSMTIKLEASLNNCPDGKVSLTDAYISNNRLDNGSVNIESELSGYLNQSRIFNSGINPENVNELESIVLSDVGSNLNIDLIDERIVFEVSSRTGGFKNSDSAAGGFDYANDNNGYEDSDQDGISDQWEIANGLNPQNPDDRNEELNFDGYTNLEIFLHALTLE